MNALHTEHEEERAPLSVTILLAVVCWLAVIGGWVVLKALYELLSTVPL